MTPPELARNAPVAYVVQPVEQDRALVVRDHLDQATVDGFLGRLGEGLHFHEPLRGNPRLDFGFAAVADTDSVRNIFDAFEQAERFEVADDARAGFEAVESRVLAGGRAHVRVVGHHVNFGKVVALADLEIVRVVRGRDLDHAGAELAVNVRVRDHGNLPVHQGQHHALADEALVALVIRMDGDGGIAKHRFGARRRDDEKFLRPDHGITQVPELARALDVDDFEIADGRLAARAPVDDVAAAIDQAFAIEPQESLNHGAIEGRFEGEALARPIAGSAQANHLLLDGAAAFQFPLPDAALEFLAAQVLAADFFLGELAFDDELRGDSSVVHAGKPQRAMAAHAVPADEHVNLRVLQHVADVDRAGNVWRRKRDRKHGAVGGIFSAEEFLVEPGLGPALFDLLRLVGLGNFPGHEFLVVLNFVLRRNNQ